MSGPHAPTHVKKFRKNKLTKKTSTDKDVRKHMSDPRLSMSQSDDLSGSNLDLAALAKLMQSVDTRQQTFPTVLKVFCTMQQPDYDNPWQMNGIMQGTGSAVIVANRMFLTAAHVIADNTFITVQRTQVDDPTRRPAKVFAVMHECDLALLQLEEDDDSFFEGVEPTQLGDLPKLRDRVYVCGFPVGGEELSITEGVVSRIEGQPYSHSQRVLLAATVDAAINPGNSGGPVFDDSGKLAGIAFQGLSDAELNGQIIPPPVIAHFLAGVESKGPKGYKGFPSLGVEMQLLENDLLRAHLKMSKNQSGVLVNRVRFGNSSAGILKVGDILLSINNQKIGNNGTLSYANAHRVDFQIVVTLFQCGDSVTLKILRDGKEESVVVTLKPQYDLVPLAQYDQLPSFFVYCGLVFQPLSLDYILNAFGPGAPKELLVLFESGEPSAERLEVVVLSQVLSDHLTVGFEEMIYGIISTVQGTKVRSLAHLVSLMEATTTGVIDIRTSENQVLIVPAAGTEEAKKGSKRVLTRYRVPADRSPDLSGAVEGGAGDGHRKLFTHVTEEVAAAAASPSEQPKTPAAVSAASDLPSNKSVAEAPK